MALDAKIVEITLNGIKEVKKSEKIKDDNGNFILNKSGNPKLRTYIEKQDRTKSSYDYWIKLSSLSLANTLTSNPYLTNYLNGNFLETVKVSK